MALIQSGHIATDKPIIQSHCYDDGAGFTYMQATGELQEPWRSDPSTPPPPPDWRGNPRDPPREVLPHDLEVYWSHEFGDAALTSLRQVYPLSNYQVDADASASLSSTGYNQYSAAQYAGFRTETDFAYLCTAKWASEHLLRTGQHL
jgi:hypothetical protein